MMVATELRHLLMISATFHVAQESSDTVRLMMFGRAFPFHSSKSLHDYFSFLSLLITTHTPHEDIFASAS